MEQHLVADAFLDKYTARTDPRQVRAFVDAVRSGQVDLRQSLLLRLMGSEYTDVLALLLNAAAAAGKPVDVQMYARTPFVRDQIQFGALTDLLHHGMALDPAAAQAALVAAAKRMIISSGARANVHNRKALVAAVASGAVDANTLPLNALVVTSDTQLLDDLVEAAAMAHKPLDLQAIAADPYVQKYTHITMLHSLLRHGMRLTPEQRERFDNGNPTRKAALTALDNPHQVLSKRARAVRDAENAQASDTAAYLAQRRAERPDVTLADLQVQFAAGVRHAHRAVVFHDPAAAAFDAALRRAIGREVYEAARVHVPRFEVWFVLFCRAMRHVMRVPAHRAAADTWLREAAREYLHECVGTGASVAHVNVALVAANMYVDANMQQDTCVDQPFVHMDALSGACRATAVPAEARMFALPEDSAQPSACDGIAHGWTPLERRSDPMRASVLFAEPAFQELLRVPSPEFVELDAEFLRAQLPSVPHVGTPASAPADKRYVQQHLPAGIQSALEGEPLGRWRGAPFR